jgi:hypothetical protein
LFDVSDWDLSPEKGQVLMQATDEQWEQLAKMSREDRVDRFSRLSKA